MNRKLGLGLGFILIFSVSLFAVSFSLCYLQNIISGAPRNTAPSTIIATAITQNFKNIRLEETKSTYFENGSETIIRPLKFGFSKEEALKLSTT